MKRIRRYSGKNTLIITTILLITPLFLSWGEAGHLRINRAAVLSLPEPMQSFFYNHIDYVTQASPIPDLRRYLLDDKAENARHYFDMENFGHYDSIPLTLADANTVYSKDFLSKNGILPWYIENRMIELTRAFKEKRKTEILFLAAELGHYIGDANTPLHTTVNYDGQMTDQKGMHSFWETRMLKMFSGEYNYYSGEAVYIKDIRQEIKCMILTSNALADTLLRIDRELKQSFPSDLLYFKIKRDSTDKEEKLVYTDEYAKEYHQRLNGMVEKQIQKSIVATSSFWYTAWVNAGKPDLSNMDPFDQTARNRKSLKKDLKLFQKGKLRDLK
jgi:hypothetical protein